MPAATAPKLKRPGMTADRVFRRLIEGILSGRIPTGTSLQEARLARAWRVSRTPMREAVRRAAEAGFVVLRPNRAPLVRALTPRDVRELYELRELLEMRALELAWPRYDAAAVAALEARAAAPRDTRAGDQGRHHLAFDLALHGSWMKLCGNSWLTADLEWLYQYLRIFQGWIARDARKLAAAYAEHLAILDAIKRRDRAAALQRLRHHIRQSAVAAEEALVRSNAAAATEPGRQGP